jgi:hypothetical protein
MSNVSIWQNRLATIARLDSAAEKAREEAKKKAGVKDE